MIIIMFLRPPLALPRGAPPPAASTAWRQKVSSVGVIEATGNLKKANPYHHNHHYPCYPPSLQAPPSNPYLENQWAKLSASMVDLSRWPKKFRTSIRALFLKTFSSFKRKTTTMFPFLVTKLRLCSCSEAEAACARRQGRRVFPTRRSLTRRLATWIGGKNNNHAISKDDGDVTQTMASC